MTSILGDFEIKKFWNSKRTGMTAYLSLDIKAIACYFKILTTALGLLYLQATKEREFNKPGE
jgi:hypothetical protein